MKNKLNISINNAIDLEEQGEYKKGLDILKDCLVIYKEEKYEILFEIGKMQFRNEDYQDAIISFIECVNENNNKIAEQLIWECYYLPNKENYRKIYEHNRKSILKYEYFIGSELREFSDLDFLLIWRDKNFIVYYCNNKFNYNYLEKEVNGFDEEGVIYIHNNINIRLLIEIEKKAFNRILLTSKTPLYIYYEQQSLMEFLIEFEEFEQLFLSGRVVFIIGNDMNLKFFSNYQAILPDYIISKDISFKNTFIKINNERKRDFYKYKNEIDTYYSGNKLIKYNIKNKKPKILFLTSRFTTVLQYHTKNCLEAIKEMGLEARVLLEEKDIYEIPGVLCYQNISELKPDIIFILDHFRFEHCFAPDEVFFVTWIQDLLPNILDENTPKKLNSNDLVLNHFITWDKVQELGYGKYCKMMDAPIPANEKIYKPYELTQEEKNKYSADICFVCHGADTEDFISEFPNKFQERQIQNLVKQILLVYKEYVKKTSKFLYTQDEFTEYVKESFDDLGTGREKIIDYVANEMFEVFNQRLFRTTVVDWLIEAGYTNLKLWGNGWLKDPKYSKYAMGPAENGKTLSKIYQASKINIGNNIMTTSAARAWECMLSGGFYMSNFIPTDADVTDIRKILTLGEDVVCFRNREDLLDKVDYYLSHEEERQIMIERGRKIALEKMTFRGLMERVLDKLAEGVEENE